MEISIEKKVDLQILGVKGKIRLQNWRLLDKHLDTMLDNGCRRVAMNLSGVSLICSAGILSDWRTLEKRLGSQGLLLNS